MLTKKNMRTKTYFKPQKTLNSERFNFTIKKKLISYGNSQNLLKSCTNPGILKFEFMSNLLLKRSDNSFFRMQQIVFQGLN